jgi:hypothetical protein
MEPIVGHASIVEAADTIAPAAPPYTYVGVAESLLPGVRILANASSTRGLPLSLVSAHVLECILKAYLSKALGSDASLRKDSKLRHNLAVMWSLAEGHGLKLPNPAPSWVECLSRLHDHPFHLRYSTGVHAVISPAPEQMASDLPQLLALVREALLQ